MVVVISGNIFLVHEVVPPIIFGFHYPDGQADIHLRSILCLLPLLPAQGGLTVPVVSHDKSSSPLFVTLQAHLSPDGDAGDEHQEWKKDFGDDGLNQLGNVVAGDVCQLAVVADLFW